jgi:hypothetical protein
VKLRSPSRLIGANIVVDAFGTATFLSGIGFFAIGSVGATPTQILHWLSIGIFAGVGLSFFASAFVDAIGPKRVLLALQTAQFVTYFALLFTGSVTLVLVLCGLGAALSRITSPVRGALPPIYLDKEQLLQFKAKVKVWIVTVTILGGGVAVVSSMLDEHGALLAIPAINCASFLAVMVLTILLPEREGATPSKKVSFRPPSVEIFLSASVFAFLIGLGSAPESAVAVLAADKEGMPAIVVAISSIAGFAVALGGQRLLKGRDGLVRRHGRSILLTSLGCEALAVSLVGIASFRNVDAVTAVALIGLGLTLAEISLLGVTYAMWDVQYSIGDDADRGRIIGVFSIATSVGLALSPALASALFFGGVGLTLLSGSVIILLGVGTTLRLLGGARSHGSSAGVR